MLKKYTSNEAINTILKRQFLDDTVLPSHIQDSITQIFGSPLTAVEVVNRILNDIRSRGDIAVSEWTQKIDGSSLEKFAVPTEKINAAQSAITPEQKSSLLLAIERVRKFHEAQPVTSWFTQSMGGTIGQLVRPIQRVGLYIPAGSAPLPSSLLMSAVPAQLAGVKEIALVVPPQHRTGEVHPLILATASLLGIEEIYTIGGAQAIGALAFGTETIRKVDKIFGPGNIFVTLAKRQVYGVVGIDSLAGPTETVVVADDTANPAWVASDLLAQAEHDPLASAILLTPSEKLIHFVQNEVTQQMERLGRKAIISASLQNRSGAVLTSDLAEAVDLANQYAPEHLCLSIGDPWKWIDRITCAGGIFLGENSCEVLGDYVAGPSHIMPTSGSARYSSPVNVLDFVHLVSLVAIDPTTAKHIASYAATLAKAESLDAHANAANMRTKQESS